MHCIGSLAKTCNQASYLMAIINSEVLSKAATPLMPKGQFGARDLLCTNICGSYLFRSLMCRAHCTGIYRMLVVMAAREAVNMVLENLRKGARIR